MAKDPYRYFRVEARELLDRLMQGVLQLEKRAGSPELIADLLRMAHTLKGAARVVKQSAIAELAHSAEDLLTKQRGTAQPLSKQDATQLLELFDRAGVLLEALEPEAKKGPNHAPSPVEAFNTVRVEIKEVDALLRRFSESHEQVEGLRRQLANADRLRTLARLLSDQLSVQANQALNKPHSAKPRTSSLAEDLQSELDRFLRTLVTDVERLERGFDEVHDATQRLRLVAAQTVFPLLERTIRDAAQALNKQVDFEALGGDVRLDAHVIAALRDALMHVVRNAVAHGIESEAERVALGKPPRGLIRLVVTRRGRRVSFVCRDDGRGVDVEAVRRAAIARGLLRPSEAQSLSVEEVLALLRTGGLTTSTELTELSGRGIGLDIVRATAASLNGQSSIHSEFGRGTSVEIQVPVSIASMQGLLVEAGGAAAAIPLDAVQKVLRLKDTEIACSANGSSILHEGNIIPFLPLDRALRRSGAAERKRQTWSAVVVQAQNRGVAVGVDRLLGTSNIVARTLPSTVEADPVVMGASLDAEGNPQLVLDPNGILAAAARGLGLVREETAFTRVPILVVDDSLTTRMLEQSILQSAGYEVELAVSAEQGLEKARERRFGLFIVDVEMPGMNGFEFVQALRADPTLRDIPAILVTSRDSPEDRRRSEAAGVQAYIVKGEFDQGIFLNTIRRLL